MTLKPVERVVIAGGGTAGWMTAAALSYSLPKTVSITLVESDDIGIVGVGEATIPPIVSFNAKLGIDEDEFLSATQGAYKFGIDFIGWGAKDARYIHPFGTYGQDMQGLKFHQFYFAQAQRGFSGLGALSDYNLCSLAAAANRFIRPTRDMGPVLHTLRYAYHFDAGLYARFLRRRAEAQGVVRVEGKIADIPLDPDSGHIRALRLDGDREIPGDVFVDCTGFRALLINGALKVPYIDWSRYLPNNRAWAATCAAVEPLTPYTRATAQEAGWIWRIPLQHRTGTGHVFCADFTTEEAAREALVRSFDGRMLREPFLIKFTTGRRETFWEKNCIAIGLAGGFLEPLESTSIHLIQSSIGKLLSLFPDKGFNHAERAEYNALLGTQYAQIRDFIIAHYKVTKRDDTPFWAYCRDMEIPDALRQKLELFAHKGRLVRHDEDLFAEDNWLAILTGQGLIPEGHDPLVDALPEAEVRDNLMRMREVLARAAQGLPGHSAFINHHCKAPSDVPAPAQTA